MLWLYINTKAFFALTTLLRYNSLFYKTQAVDTNGYEVPRQPLLKQHATALVNVFTAPAWSLKLTLVYRIQTAQTATPAGQLFASLTWGEREISELLGVNYNFKIDARRLMLDYAFEGTPLKKNFPSAGFEEIEYNAQTRWLTYKRIKIRDDVDF